ncbi:MAG: radical SAM-associated putative lipoprotein [Bacteroidales bacterium]|nr:radical SAM-associated putative lipoprotein [Bacteroidales bacterium]
MKYKLYRVLLTMLGFAACAPQPNPGTTDSTDNPPDTPVENLSGMYGPPMAEYGVPHVNLVINGAVSDPDGNPIPGIKVSTWNWLSGQVSKKTDAEGKVEMNTGLESWDLEQLYIAFQDIDGPENGGTFAADTLHFKDLEVKQIGEAEGGWLDGTYQVDFDHQLKPAEDSE